MEIEFVPIYRTAEGTRRAGTHWRGLRTIGLGVIEHQSRKTRAAA